MKKIIILLTVLSVTTLTFAQDEIEPITVVSKPANNTLSAPVGTGFFMGYQHASMGKDYNDNLNTKSTDGFFLSMFSDFAIWKPIGIELQLDFMNMSFANSHGEYENYYYNYHYYGSDLSRTMWNFNIGLMPSFWCRLNKNSAIHFITGPKLVITAIHEITGENYEYKLVKSDKNPYGMYNRCNVAWGVGVGFNYKHIGLRVMYEKELMGRYANMSSSDPNNPRFGYISVGLFIPIYLGYAE